MVYNPATDFVGLWRASGGNVSKMELPGLDFVIAALARAGIITLSVSATAPVANQSITAWLRPAVPSWTAEGAFFLWDKVTTAYLAATPKLFLQFLEATAGENGTSWWTSVGGPPLNTVGNNGDFALRTDTPNGIYGPKAAGAWPATPVPGTADVITSVSLDNTFGAVPGQIIYRGPALWQPLAIGAEDTVLTSLGGFPAWDSVLSLLDVLFGTVQGSILYRDAGAWNDLPPGVINQVLATNGPGANPAWVARTPEFLSGTRLVFHQTNAPVGWTKQTLLNDYGLRVVSGAAGTVAGSAFSTVFAQSVVGNHTVTLAESPPHVHNIAPLAIIAGSSGGGGVGGGGVFGIGGAQITDSQGGGAAHNHPINLTLSYTDVIIASKD